MTKNRSSCSTLKTFLSCVLNSEAVTHLEVYKKYFLKITPNSSENTCAVALFNEATDPRTVSLSKRDSGTGVFQWIWQSFSEYLFIDHLLRNGCVNSDHIFLKLHPYKVKDFIMSLV